jgi:hypothetical protein
LAVVLAADSAAVGLAAAALAASVVDDPAAVAAERVGDGPGGPIA